MKRILKNTSWLLVGNLFRMLFQFAVSVVIARYLGPEQQGKINYVAAYTAFFSTIVGLGINGVIIHELVNHREQGRIVGTAMCLRFIAGLISLAIMVLLMNLIETGNHELRWIAVLQAVQLPFAALDTVKYVYQWRLESYRSVIVTSTGYAVSCLFKVYLVVSEKNVVWFGFAGSLDIMLIGAFYQLSYVRNKEESLSWSFDAAKRILRGCAPFILANLMAFVYSRIDTIMIRYMTGSMELVGLYGTAVTICGLTSFVPTALLDSARPVIMEAKRTNGVQYQSRMRRLCLAVIAIGAAYSIFVMAFGRYILAILYGEDYLGSLGSLQIAVWYTAFSYLGGVKSVWLICENKSVYVFRFAVLGAAANVLLNALMIPGLSIRGAAWATLITQCLTNLIFPMLWKDTRGFAVCVKDAVLLRGTWELLPLMRKRKDK